MTNVGQRSDEKHVFFRTLATLPAGSFWTARAGIVGKVEEEAD